MDNIEKLADIVKNSRNIVFFGGAGVSTESGIPDFRSVSTRIYPEPHFFYPQDRGILPLLQS